MSDFRDLVRHALQETAGRFAYVDCQDRYVIVCRFDAHDDVLVVSALLELMRDNPVLTALQEGVDYTWEGASMIAFSDRAAATAYYLLCPF